MNSQPVIWAALARAAVDAASNLGEAGAHAHGGMPPQIHLLIAASGTLLLLLGATTLSVYKPWGKTAFGSRR